MTDNEPIRIDFTKPDHISALEEATELLSRGYRLMRDALGVDNPGDNKFVREAQLCVKGGAIWSGGRGEVDGFMPDGGEVEIKSTRLDKDGGIIQFPTSRLVSIPVIERYRRMDVWLYGVFSVAEELIAAYMADKSGTEPIIDWLNVKRQEAIDQGKAELNNPKVTLRMLRPHAELIFMHHDYEEYEKPNGTPCIRRKDGRSVVS